MHRIRRSAATVALAAIGGLATPAVAFAGRARLGGSPASMVRQHEVAVAQDYTFARTPADVRTLADEGRLERITDARDFVLVDVSYPFARPEVRVFLQRLAAQYRDALGTRLVVTSLTRPTSLQPRNAHALSVHPAGMAVDFRVPAKADARQWLEETLLALESAGVLDVTREKTPAHYHVAVYPTAYRAYAEKQSGETFAALIARAPEPTPLKAVASAAAPASVAPVVEAPLPDEGGYGFGAMLLGAGVMLATGTLVYAGTRSSIADAEQG